MDGPTATATDSTRRTRLIATIGPASVERLDDLVTAGLDVARINLSHGAASEHRHAASAIRAAARDAGRTVGILVDLPGPKLRLADLHVDVLHLATRSSVAITGPGVPASDGSLPLGDGSVLPRLQVGDRILLADGAAELRVTATDGDGDRVHAEVVRGGAVRSRQGVSVPAERMPSAALGDTDLALMPHLLELGPDFVGQSFVRSAADVEALRERLPGSVGIVAKIETRPAVRNIEAILHVADVIMVARGDLGVELPFEQVPLVQKDLVSAALAAGRPSIVATQMLESMTEAPRPTRAEASDVANAVLDGADAVMLSGETAVGRWPVEALRAAAAICEAVDERRSSIRPPDVLGTFGDDADARALAVAAVAMAEADADVAILACYTRSGRTARRLAALRPGAPILAFTPDAAVARSLALCRGVRSVVLERGADEDIDAAVARALRVGGPGWRLRPDDAVALVRTSGQGGPNRLERLRL